MFPGVSSLGSSQDARFSDATSLDKEAEIAKLIGSEWFSIAVEEEVDKAFDIAKTIESTTILHFMLSDICNAYLKLSTLQGCKKAYEVAQYKEQQRADIRNQLNSIVGVCLQLQTAEALSIARKIFETYSKQMTFSEYKNEFYSAQARLEIVAPKKECEQKAIDTNQQFRASPETAKIKEIIDYLNKYQQQIEAEDCSEEFTQVSQLLDTLTYAVDSHKSRPFSNASFILGTDRAVRILNSMKLPETAKIANRIFKTVLMKDLQAFLGISKIAEFLGPQSLVDYRQNAGNYESLAANSYDDKFIVTNLLCALGCLRMAQSGQEDIDESLLAETSRIEGLLGALKTPMELGYAFRYLFRGFETHGVSFSIHHPRFFEVLNNLSTMVNETGSEETMATVIMKWVNILK